MASVDYDTRSDDHQSILILVEKVGSETSSGSFNKVFERLSRMNYVKVQDKQVPGWQRGVWISFQKTYSKESNEWGDFQAHRKLLGLLTIGKCTKEDQLEEICKAHKELQEKYKPTLYDSRCLAFGMTSLPVVESSTPSSSADSSADHSAELETDQLQEHDSAIINKETDSDVRSESDIKLEFDDPKLQTISTEDEVISETSSSTQPLSSPSSPSPETEATDVAGSVTFPVPIESSTSDDSNRRNSLGQKDSVPTKIQMVPVEGNSRGVPCIPYNGFDECDKLELDIYEFLSSVFFILESKRLSYVGQDKQLKQDNKYPLLKAPFENKDLVGVDLDTKNFKRKCMGRMKKHLGDISLQSGLPMEALTMYLAAADTLRSACDWLWLASTYEGQCAASIALLHPPQSRSLALQRNCSVPLPGRNTMPRVRTTFVSLPSRSLPSGFNPTDAKTLGKNMLTYNEITEKYKEAFEWYSKSKPAFFIGIECCIKATRVHVLLERYIIAAAFLQNVVFSNLQQSEEEKLVWFCTLADLYTELGFHRKAAFFKWIAATRYSVLPVNPENCSKPYHLILETFDGYQLSLDPKEFLAEPVNGWPRLQIQVILELIVSAKRMGNQPLAVRHTSFLLYTMFIHLTPSERRDYCTQLETLAAKCEGGPVPLALDTGLIIPPVNLLNLPLVRSFKLQSLAPHLRPVKLLSREDKTVTDKMGPFIFSPLMMNKEQNVKTNKLDFKWVEGDVCEVALQVFNPLPFELRVTHMGLMADGVAFESFPACLSLPAESGPYPVNLLGTPRSSGELQVLGYTTHVLGVKSNCRLKDLSRSFFRETSFIIDVIPCLPQLQLTTSLPKASMFSTLADTSHVVMNTAISLFSGESRECSITLNNIGNESVDKVDIHLQTKLGKELESQFLTWSTENLNMQLPILPGHSASFTLYIHAITGFIHSPAMEVKGTPKKERLTRATPSSSPATNSPRYRNKSAVASPEPFPPKIIEAVIQLQYTGGPGMNSDYCRQCAVALTVEVLPSLVITKWDVLPAEIATHCYLVLDVLNASKNEMELQYAANKCICVEAQDTCRIPVPVERCPVTPSMFSSPEKEPSNVRGINTAVQGTQQSLRALCKQHLVNLVDLTWTIPGLELSGKTSIAEVPWTSSMLDGILMSPIQWDISLSGRPFKFEDEFSFKIGELITLSITLNNLSDNGLKNLCLRISGYQDYQNGHRTYRLETKRAIVGMDRIIIDEIVTHGQYSHECGMVFFHAGVYKLDIQCGCPGYPASATMASLARSSPAHHRGAGEGRRQEVSGGGAHTWRCTPSVEINITQS